MTEKISPAIKRSPYLGTGHCPVWLVAFRKYFPQRDAVAPHVRARRKGAVVYRLRGIPAKLNNSLSAVRE